MVGKDGLPYDFLRLMPLCNSRLLDRISVFGFPLRLLAYATFMGYWDVLHTHSLPSGEGWLGLALLCIGCLRVLERV